MKVDRHNYEECFILYWDNELTAAQRQAVEDFVKENADLQEEFKILGQTRFIPDQNIQFEEKEFLSDNSFINITNYEEQLLNYIDDELTPDQKNEVEKFVAQSPTVQPEFAWLQKTKLQPEEEINFPDKSILYRREEKPVIRMTWFRVAVAAAIILIAGFATLRLVNTKKGGEVVTVAQKKSNSTATPSIEKVPNNRPSDEVKIREVVSPVPPTIERKKQNPAIENKIETAIASENKNDLPKERNKNSEPVINPIIETTEVIANISMDNNKVQRFETNKTNLDNSSVTKSTSPAFAKLDEEIPNDNFGKEKDKGGLKEFLRKTTRVFERRTKIQTTTDDNKLLLGAFAVSLK